MKCNKCGVEKQESDFDKNRKICKECRRESDKKLWRENESRRSAVKTYREKNRFGLNATEFVKDKTCERCGISNEEHIRQYGERLHIHHPDNNGRHNQRLGMKPVNSNLIVLCKSCHIKEETQMRISDEEKREITELYDKHGEIQIRCRGADSLPIDAILDFQGGLKKLSHGNLLRLAGSIFREGFCAPFFIWQNEGECFCLDGHQRLATLIAIREAGVPIPGLFPVAYIEAETEQEAREKLLVITSQYGEFQVAQLDNWMKSVNDDINNIIRLTDREMKYEIFSPNENPQQSNRDITDDDIDKANEKMENRYERNDKRTLETICPECGHVFKIDC